MCIAYLIYNIIKDPRRRKMFNFAENKELKR